MTFKILSYNIHKGFDATNRKSTLANIKDSIDVVHADLVCLQEILGNHNIHGSQLEILADTVWHNYAYGKNSVYSKGDHGNAILSKFIISKWQNTNISANFLDKRGILHATLSIGESAQPLHVITTHLGLLQAWRKKQLHFLKEYIHKNIPSGEALVLTGDFNDWTVYATEFLHNELQIDEAFYQTTGQHARTFPSRWPLLALDRIYFRNLKLKEALILDGPLWHKLSDHVPLFAEFEI